MPLAYRPMTAAYRSGTFHQNGRASLIGFGMLAHIGSQFFFF